MKVNFNIIYTIFMLQKEKRLWNKLRFYCNFVSFLSYMVQQKIVIKVQMACDKCRAKAMKIAAIADDQHQIHLISLFNLSIDFGQLKIFFWLISRTTRPPQEKGKDWEWLRTKLHYIHIPLCHTVQSSLIPSCQSLTAK